MISVQLTLPFYVPYWIIKKVKKVKILVFLKKHEILKSQEKNK